MRCATLLLVLVAGCSTPQPIPYRPWGPDLRPAEHFCDCLKTCPAVYRADFHHVPMIAPVTTAYAAGARATATPGR